MVLPAQLKSIGAQTFVGCPFVQRYSRSDRLPQSIHAAVTDLDNKISAALRHANQAGFSSLLLSSQAPAIILSFFYVTLPQHSSANYQSAPVWQYLMFGGIMPHTVNKLVNTKRRTACLRL